MLLDCIAAAPRKDVTKVNLTMEQASGLIAQLKAAIEGRQPLLDIVMPNGKKMIDWHDLGCGSRADQLTLGVDPARTLQHQFR